MGESSAPQHRNGRWALALAVGLVAAISFTITVLMPRARRVDVAEPTAAASPTAAGTATADRTRAKTSGPRPPRLAATVPEFTKVEVDPADPNYDPRGLAAVIRIGPLFLREPRNPVWAEKVEQTLTQPLLTALQEIVPEVTNLKMGCRSTGCELTWELKQPNPENSFRANRALAQIYPGMRTRSGPNSVITFWNDPLWKDGDRPGDVRKLDQFLPRALGRIPVAIAWLQNPEGQRSMRLPPGAGPVK
jgi:hypothetical protein